MNPIKNNPLLKHPPNLNLSYSDLTKLHPLSSPISILTSKPSAISSTSSIVCKAPNCACKPGSSPCNTARLEDFQISVVAFRLLDIVAIRNIRVRKTRPIGKVSQRYSAWMYVRCHGVCFIQLKPFLIDSRYYLRTNQLWSSMYNPVVSNFSDRYSSPQLQISSTSQNSLGPYVLVPGISHSGLSGDMPWCGAPQ